MGYQLHNLAIGVRSVVDEHSRLACGRNVASVGAYSGAQKTIIYCVVSRLEMAKMKEVIKKIDPSAFISVVDVHEAYGGRTKGSIDKI